MHRQGCRDLIPSFSRQIFCNKRMKCRHRSRENENSEDHLGGRRHKKGKDPRCHMRPDSYRLKLLIADSGLPESGREQPKASACKCDLTGEDGHALRVCGQCDSSRGNEGCSCQQHSSGRHQQGALARPVESVRLQGGYPRRGGGWESAILGKVKATRPSAGG